VLSGVSGSSGSQAGGKFTAAMVMVLISLPIWLLIVLLSPIDAYTSAKTIVTGESYNIRPEAH
jgi:hypothetical protein